MVDQDVDVVAYVTYAIAAVALAASIFISEAGALTGFGGADGSFRVSEVVAHSSSGMDAEKVTPLSVGSKVSSNPWRSPQT